MTRQLLLLRHAKSSWDDPSLADHERPLSKRGRKAAAAMRAFMRAEGFITPDLALVSAARRARETFDALGPWSKAPQVELLATLYQASAAEMLEILREAPQSIGCILLVGHNPGLMELALLLAGSDATTAGEAKRMASAYPTGGLARFELDGPWSKIEKGAGRLAGFTIPRELKGPRG